MAAIAIILARAAIGHSSRLARSSKCMVRIFRSGEPTSIFNLDATMGSASGNDLFGRRDMDAGPLDQLVMRRALVLRFAEMPPDRLRNERKIQKHRFGGRANPH